jgi:ketosteroid isomerase-like protein
MSSKDIRGAMSCFVQNPELIVVLYGEVLRGQNAVRHRISEMFAENESVTLSIDDVKHWRSGNAILAVGTATYRLRGADGTPSVVHERWTDVRRKINGRWVYVLDHAEMLLTA